MERAHGRSIHDDMDTDTADNLRDDIRVSPKEIKKLLRSNIIGELGLRC